MNRIILLAFALMACTDTEWERYEALGDSHHVNCYSGGKSIYEGHSTGRVLSPTDSDGWQFKDAETGELVEVSGDCVIRVGGES